MAADLDPDAFWLDLVRLTNSNMAVEGFGHIAELIDSGKLDERTLRRLASALRSLSAKATDKASEQQSARLRPWELVR